MISTLSHDLPQILEKKDHQKSCWPIYVCNHYICIQSSSGLPLSGFLTCGLTKITKPWCVCNFNQGTPKTRAVAALLISVCSSNTMTA